MHGFVTLPAHPLGLSSFAATSVWLYYLRVIGSSAAHSAMQRSRMGRTVGLLHLCTRQRAAAVALVPSRHRMRHHTHTWSIIKIKGQDSNPRINCRKARRRHVQIGSQTCGSSQQTAVENHALCEGAHLSYSSAMNF